MRRKVIVMGCPRSGTHYTKELLRGHGLDVDHEGMGPDGSVAFFYATRKAATEYARGTCADVWDQLEGENPPDLGYGPFLHQVREPISVMSSIHALHTFSTGAIPRYATTCTHRGILTNLMEFWVEWNKRCEAICEWTYRVEDLSNPDDQSTLQELCSRLKPAISARPTMLRHVSRSEATFARHPDKEYLHITKNDMREADPVLTQEIMEMAERYGY